MSPAPRPSGRGRGRGGSGKGGNATGSGRGTSGRSNRSQSKSERQAETAKKRTVRAADLPGRAKKASSAKRPSHAPKGRPVARRGPPGPIDPAMRTKPKSPAARTRATGVGGEQVEGRQAVRELLLADRRRVREILVSADVDAADILDEIIELADETHVPLKQIGRSKLEALARTDAPQGIIARAAELEPVDLDDLTQPRDGRAPFLLALDGVTDPGNLGALLRSAECAGVTGIVLPRHRAVHVTPAVTKAAAGAIERLDFALVGGMPTAIDRLRKLGVWSVGLDMTGPKTLWELDSLDEPVVLVLGAEGKGLSRLARQRCDQVARIPLTGRLDSLNVSVAGALACFEVTRARRSA
jgi:23S rRNA (guanosine2251-2'-O)-methyltransferase